MEKSTKKVATMTFHIAHNYGAMLQAYALEKKINQLGYDCEVLDYRFPYIDNWSGIRTLKELQQEFGILIGTLKFVKRRLTCYRKISPARKKFNDFMRNELDLSKEVYFNKQELHKAEYDYIVFGSDQIWNPDLTDGFATEYMGEYFSRKTKLVSYAASCGLDCFKPQWKEVYYPLLKKFTALGIREEPLAEYIAKNYGLNAKTVLDPVFLLEPKAWREPGKSSDLSVNRPYLLIYTFQTDDEIYRLARRIAKERSLKLVTISYQREEKLDDMIQLTSCGPKDFIALIENADFICTTSFHGMAFSIIFEKSFYCIGHPKYSSRNYSLLNMLEMTDRMVSRASDVNVIEDCDYSGAGKILEQKRQESIDFIVNALEA